MRIYLFICRTQFISTTIKLTDIEFTFHRVFFLLDKSINVAELTEIVRFNNFTSKTSLLAKSQQKWWNSTVGERERDNISMHPNEWNSMAMAMKWFHFGIKLKWYKILNGFIVSITTRFQLIWHNINIKRLIKNFTKPKINNPQKKREKTVACMYKS